MTDTGQTPRILYGVSGASAALNTSSYLLRLSDRLGVMPTVIMSPTAAQFVSPQALAAVLGSTVHVDPWSPEARRLLPTCDVMVVAPTSANSLAKFAVGMTDTLLAWAFASAECPRIVAPSMGRALFESAAVQRNLEQLLADGVRILPCERGRELSTGTLQATGLCSPDVIAEALLDSLGGEIAPRHPLAGRTAASASTAHDRGVG